jgi:hypothetical protein
MLRSALVHHAPLCLDALWPWPGPWQVTACAFVSCGPGQCYVGSAGPECDCRGTSTTGQFCDVPMETPLINACTPAGTGSLVGNVTSTGPRKKQCPVGVDVKGAATECSGHGACATTPNGCMEGDPACTASCRSVQCVCATLCVFAVHCVFAPWCVCPLVCAQSGELCAQCGVFAL